MIMRIDSRHPPGRLGRDTDERRQPRSLDLALRRMGFRPRPGASGDERLPATWQTRCDDAAPDWRPL